MTEYEDLLLDRDSGIVTITLNVPEKLNALTQPMRRSLISVVGEIARDDEVRVVIITGAGRGFCSGADVSDQAARLSGEAIELPRRILLGLTGGAFCDLFPNLNKPIIAAINGPCAGMGFSLALSMDIRIASESARFVSSQIARGLVPDVGLSYYLPQAVGHSSALELIFTARQIDATEAEHLGIVSKVVPAGDLLKAAHELAQMISQQPPVSVELTKRMVWRGIKDNLDRQLDLETYAQNICTDTEDHKEGIKAFFEKRPPRFKGR